MPIVDPDRVWISFAGVNYGRIQLGGVLPMPQFKSRMKEHYMSQGSSGLPGIRVLEPLGAHVSYGEFSFTIELLTAGQANSLESSFFNQNTVRQLTINVPGEAPLVYSYKVLFAEDGLNISLQDSWVEYSDEYPFKADIKLKILTRVS